MPPRARRVGVALMLAAAAELVHSRLELGRALAGPPSAASRWGLCRSASGGVGIGTGTAAGRRPLAVACTAPGYAAPAALSRKLGSWIPAPASSPPVLLHVAGSFNPPHTGHARLIEEASRTAFDRTGRWPSAVVVAIKSDRRLARKAYSAEGGGEVRRLPYEARRALFAELVAAARAEAWVPEVHFDDHWRDFEGDPKEIRRATDAFFEGRGLRVLRTMGEDQVQRFGLQDDPAVICVPRPRGALSSTQVRAWLRQHDLRALGRALPAPYARRLAEVYYADLGAAPLAAAPARKVLPPALNWHCEPRCNFACEFCFATFEDVKKLGKRTRIDQADALRLLGELVEAGVEKITFVGGEPMLHPLLEELIKASKDLKLTTCVVTNGSLLSPEWLKSMRPHLDWLGISIDASSDDLHVKLGRASASDLQQGRSDHLGHLKEMWALARELGYGLKLNTVVSRPTLDDDMSKLVLELRPHRWKVFQVLPIDGENNGKVEPLLVSGDEFDGWVERHRAHVEQHGIQIVAERNDDMRGTYAMLDPQGRFYTNADGRYKYSRSAVDIGVPAAWSDVDPGFDGHKFVARGGSWAW